MQMTISPVFSMYSYRIILQLNSTLCKHTSLASNGMQVDILMDVHGKSDKMAVCGLAARQVNDCTMQQLQTGEIIIQLV